MQKLAARASLSKSETKRFFLLSMEQFVVLVPGLYMANDHRRKKLLFQTTSLFFSQGVYDRLALAGLDVRLAMFAIEIQQNT